jgi:hypothetical protein
MIFVSHDRMFLRGLGSRVLELGGESGADRTPTVYSGSYVEYVQKLGHEAPGIYSQILQGFCVTTRRVDIEVFVAAGNRGNGGFAHRRLQAFGTQATVSTVSLIAPDSTKNRIARISESFGRAADQI